MFFELILQFIIVVFCCWLWLECRLYCLFVLSFNMKRFLWVPCNHCSLLFHRPCQSCCSLNAWTGLAYSLWWIFLLAWRRGSHSSTITFCTTSTSSCWSVLKKHNFVCISEGQDNFLLGRFVVNISQIKRTWFSFVFLFVTDLSNYNAVVFTGKRRARMEGIPAFILSLKKESQNKAYTESPTKNMRNFLVLSRDLRYSSPTRLYD